MKKIVLVVSIAATCLAVSCKKKDKDNSNTSTPATAAVDTMRYTVNNISDVTIRRYQDSNIYLPLMLKHKSGMQEAVTVQLNGLPSGVISATDSLKGIPSFNANFILGCYFTSVGTFPVTVTTKGAVSGTKTFTFNMNVVANPTCATNLSGIYNESGSCNADPTISYPATVSTTSTAGKVSVNASSTASFFATVDCSNATLSMVTDTVVLMGGPTIRTGSGTFGSKTFTMNIHQKLMNAPHTESDCTLTFKKD